MGRSLEPDELRMMMEGRTAMQIATGQAPSAKR
jgi:hypothetical protein